ncbi:MAG TPA: hypothetical protein VMJ10_01865 [Kofleriaceae bacterium]|nr:hypothetical protein [Kofleriaceae bacterium]
MVVAAGALMLCLASAGKQDAGNGFGATQKNTVFYETKPKFEWPHQKGSTYRVVLWRVPNNPAQQRVALYDQQNYTEHHWSPPDDLDFETHYELYIYNDQQAIVSSWGFAIGYEQPKVLDTLAEQNAKVNSLSPQIHVTPTSYQYVYYQFVLSDTSAFDADKIIDQAFIPQEGNIQQYPGPDGEMNTADDVKYVEWNVARVLKPNRTYYWRVRSYYFTKSDVEGNKTPDPQNALGHAEQTGVFSIPPQSGSDSLANITQITRDKEDTLYPSINKRLALAYVSCVGKCWKVNPESIKTGKVQIGSELHVAGVTIRGGVPVYDTGREEFTKSVKGSWDERPQWDVDGEGIFFDSNRSQDRYNVWYKRRDARGYTQLTFNDFDAQGPSVSKDGNKIAYQVRNNENGKGWSIWVVDREGRAATELGAGEQPAFSPDGTKIAFSLKDGKGDNQIWIMDANGGNRIQITNEYKNIEPAWHPSGKRLVFTSTRSGNADIWMVELEGARMVQLTNYEGDDITPEFTPDGRYIMFASTRGGDEFMHLWMGELASVAQ